MTLKFQVSLARKSDIEYKDRDPNFVDIDAPDAAIQLGQMIMEGYRRAEKFATPGSVGFIIHVKDV